MLWWMIHVGLDSHPTDLTWCLLISLAGKTITHVMAQGEGILWLKKLPLLLSCFVLQVDKSSLVVF